MNEKPELNIMGIVNSASGIEEPPAPGVPAPFPQCSGQALKLIVLCQFLAHAFLLASLILFYLRVVPLFLELCPGENDFPPQTNFVIALTNFLRTHWLLFPAIVIALLWLDVSLYLLLHRRHGLRMANLWSRAIGWGIIALIFLSLWALFSPMFRTLPPINPPH